MPSRSQRSGLYDGGDDGSARASTNQSGQRASGLHLAIRGLVQVAVQLARNPSRSDQARHSADGSPAPSRANSEGDSFSDSASTVSGSRPALPNRIPNRDNSSSPNHLAAAFASLGIGNPDAYVRAISGETRSRAPSIVGDQEIIPNVREQLHPSQYSEYCARNPISDQLPPLDEDEEEDEDDVPPLSTPTPGQLMTTPSIGEMG